MHQRRTSPSSHPSIWLVCLFLAICCLHCVTSREDIVPLRVSVRRDTLDRVPSCQHTFTQVELLNLHSSDPILIHSIRTAPEETTLLSRDRGTFEPGSSKSRSVWGDGTIPQQVHVSRLPSGSLTLGPGQVAIVPVTFLPRYPLEEASSLDTQSNGSGSDDEEEIMTATLKADWAQLVSELPAQARSNAHLQQPYGKKRSLWSTGDQSPPTYEVRTTIVVDTSRGEVELPITATSVRHNAYGLPDVITFRMPPPESSSRTTTKSPSGKSGSRSDASSHDEDSASTSSSASKTSSPSSVEVTSEQDLDGVVLLYTDTTGEGGESDLSSAIPYIEDSQMNNRVSAEEAKLSSTTEANQQDCYSIMITNPSPDQSLEILDVLVSRPRYMGVQVAGSPSDSPFSAVLRQTLIRGQSYIDGDEMILKHPFIIPPATQQWIVKVCTGEVPSDETTETYLEEMTHWIDEGSAFHSLGFLQIRTDAEVLFVALEKHPQDVIDNAQSQRRDDVSRMVTSSTTATSGRNGGLSSNSQGFLVSESPNLVGASSSGTEASAWSNGSSKRGRHSDAGQRQSSSASKDSGKPLIHSPSSLDFNLLSSRSAEAELDMAFTNPTEHAMKIMRATVGVHVHAKGSNQQSAHPDLLGLSMTVQILQPVIDADSTLDSVIRITCNVDWETFEKQHPRKSHHREQLDSMHLTGTLVIRATSRLDLDYQEWTVLMAQHQQQLQRSNEDQRTLLSSAEFCLLQVPMTISLVQGKLGIMIHRTSHPFPHLWSVRAWREGLGSISSIFYPVRPFEIQPELDGQPSEPIFDNNGIDHRLRIFSNMRIPLQLSSVAVVDSMLDEQGYPNFGRGSSLCDRFDVSFEAAPEGEFPFKGFTDVGLVVVRYKFPTEDPEETAQEQQPKHSGSGYDRLVVVDQDRRILLGSAPVFPTTCLLTLTTKPFTEVHKTPLIVYPGQIDITATEASSDAVLRNITFQSVRNQKTKKSKMDRKEETMVRQQEEPSTTDDTSEGQSETLVGFKSLLRWYKRSSVGTALKEVLEKTTMEGPTFQSNGKGRENSESTAHLLGRYIYNLCKDYIVARYTTLRPVLLKLGAIQHETLEKASFYLTNHNPVPLLVSIDVGEVEGMSISLARVPTTGRTGDGGGNILDHFPQKSNFDSLVPSGEWEGHPLAGLRKFLQSSSASLEFLNLFPFRDAIAQSTTAIKQQPMLNTLYKKYAFGEFHQDQLPIRFSRDGWSHCEGGMHPPGYFNSTSTDRRRKRKAGPLMISADSSIERPLKICWDKEGEPLGYPSDGTYIIIPPGAVAQFELKIHAPPREMLQDDITRFLNTGLVLSTDHGEVLPIFVAFEALQGTLKLSHTSVRTSIPRNDVEEQDLVDNITSGRSVLSVPQSLLWQRLSVNGSFDAGSQLSDYSGSNLTIPPDHSSCFTCSSTTSTNFTGSEDEHGVSLYVKSSFSQDIRLLMISSCNPWFQVELQNPDLQQEPEISELGINIGTLESRVSCESPESGSSLQFPSFYQCALNWLANRTELQPTGCGMERTFLNGTHGDLSLNHLKENAAVDRALRAFRQALLVSRFAFDQDDDHNSFIDYPKRVKRGSGDGLIAPVVLNVFAEVWDAWRVVAEFGLRVLTSSLRATIEYESERSNPSHGSLLQNFSVVMRDLVVESVLTTPKLFNNGKSDEVLQNGAGTFDEAPSVVEFPPTAVANVAYMTLPLRNPTAVPVRVRLSSAPAFFAHVGDFLSESFVTDDKARSSFLGDYETPYMQSQRLNSSRGTPENAWWDGGGGFFMADSHGDVIRSHHLIRIRAVGGANIGLVSPSLHSNMAFLVGCGVRCGIVDDIERDDRKHISIIGAAASNAATLMGRSRGSVSHMSPYEEFHTAYKAGASMPGKDGPSAFAIPYSALDELIIPPFGEVDIGPIYFRPPGRFSMHGCTTAAENLRSPNGEKKAKACSSNMFESMIFLENSLTGLERVLLKGTATWERVIFLDPPTVDGSDDFGNIELRNGRSALVFSGSRATRLDQMWRAQELASSAGAVVKEVVIKNDGDVPVHFAHVYLSDTVRLQDKRFSSDSPCSMGNFRLLQCSMRRDGSQNIRNGLKLLPGENRSLYIEHVPDCKKQVDYVSLNLEFQRENHIIERASATGSIKLTSAKLQQTTAKMQQISFGAAKLDLLVGYDLSHDFHSCIPASRRRKMGSKLKGGDRLSFETSWLSAVESFVRELVVRIAVVLLVVCVVTIVFHNARNRETSSIRFLSGLEGRNVVGGGSDSQRAGSWLSNWSAAFRCLARTDPTSSELQTLGREQIRHVVLARYRTLGILPPQCFSSTGGFQRERTILANSPQRQIPGQGGSTSGNERRRTLSDSIFRDYTLHEDTLGQGLLPCGLGWRSALSRGFLKPSTVDLSNLHLRTPELLVRRIEETLSDDDDVRNDDSGKPLDEVDEGNEAVVEGESEQGTEENVSFQEESIQEEVGTDANSMHLNGGPSLTSETPVDTVTVAKPMAFSDGKEGKKVTFKGLKENPLKVAIDKRKEKTCSVPETPKPQAEHRAGLGNKVKKETMTNKGVNKGGDSNKTSSNRVIAGTSEAATVGKASALSQKPNKEARAKKNDSKVAQQRTRSKQGTEKSKQNQRKEKQTTTGPVESSTERRTEVDDLPTGRKKRAGKAKKESDNKKQGKESTKAASNEKPKASGGSNKKRGKVVKEVSVAPTATPSEKADPKFAPQAGESKSASVLRPPPGLAPPPGFTQDDATVPVVRGLTLSSPSTYSRNPGAGDIVEALPAELLPASAFLSEQNLLATSSIPSHAMNASTHSLPSSSGYAPPVLNNFSNSSSLHGVPDDQRQPGFNAPDSGVSNGNASLDSILNNSMSGFDVMDFLDSILEDDRSTQSQSQRPPQQSLPVAVAQSSTNNPFVQDTVAPTLSLNPWATEHQSSRAASYGFFFEDAVETQSKPSIPTLHGVMMNASEEAITLPPLDGTAILSPEENKKDDDESESFYAKLLNE